MEKFKRRMTTICAAHFPGYLRQSAFALAFVAAQVLPIVVQAQAPGLNTCWPAFDYDGKPAQTDASHSKTTVTSSRRETPRFTAQSRTMTTADGKTQIRLDDKKYHDFAAEEYAVTLTNLSETEPTGTISNFRSLKLAVKKPDSASAVTLNVLRGSTCKTTDFVPEAFHVEVGEERVLATPSGRSSNDYIPFLELTD